MPLKPILFDLYCKAGGCTRGYHEAGFYVVGADHEPQPNYCGNEFMEFDAIAVLRTLVDGGTIVTPTGGVYTLADVAAIHASPPCQASTRLRSRHADRDYPELIPDTRELLRATGLPCVIENVEGAKLIEPTVLCGSVFGLGVRRHRLFETNFDLPSPGCAHTFQPEAVPVYGHTGAGANRGAERGRGRRNDVAEWRKAMGIDWMTADELAQAIPPAYTRYIGAFLLAHLDRHRGRPAAQLSIEAAAA
jgi:DNA (cytosine-5)-methyltransferase 1